jgi:hypothetical protein
MKTLLFIIALLAALTYGQPAFAQTTPSADSLNIIMIVDPNDHTMSVGDLDFKPTTRGLYKAVFILHDTTTTSKFHVKMGSAAGTSNYINKTFVFDQSGSFPDGTAYERIGRTVYLNLGTYAGISTYAIELKVENTNGQLSSPLNLTNTN